MKIFERGIALFTYVMFTVYSYLAVSDVGNDHPVAYKTHLVSAIFWGFMAVYTKPSAR